MKKAHNYTAGLLHVYGRPPEKGNRGACIHSRARSISRCSHGMALTGSRLTDELEESAFSSKKR